MFFSPHEIRFVADARIVESRLFFADTLVPIRVFTSTPEQCIELQFSECLRSGTSTALDPRYWQLRDVGQSGSFRMAQLRFCGEELTRAARSGCAERTDLELYDAFVSHGSIELYASFTALEHCEPVSKVTGLVLALDYAPGGLRAAACKPAQP